MVSSINNLITHKVTNKNNDSFVGIKFIKNDVHLYYPESYHLDTKEDIISLLNTFNISNFSKNKTSINNMNIEDNVYALSSYLWLIEDYFKNGIIVNRETVYKTNQNGKVNWKRTLQQNPIVSNGNVIYTNIVVETKSNTNNILIEIYKYCLKRSVEVIGFIFNINSNFLETKPFNEIVKGMYISTLYEELSKTFDDLRKEKLNHLLNIIKGLDNDNDSKETVYGVDNYHNIYEYMINNIFSNINDIKDFYPKATWQLIGLNEFESSKLRPDTILIKDNNAYILDAKYYRYGTTSDISHLPDTSSISKQIIYAEYVEQLKSLNIKNIYNAFLLPYNKNDNQFGFNDVLSYIGKSKSEWKDSGKSYHFIHAFLIDLNYIIKSYKKYNNDMDIDRLINSIEHNL